MSNANELFAEMLDEQPEDAVTDQGPRLPHLTWKFGDRKVADYHPDGDQAQTVAYHGGWFLADDTCERFSIDTDALEEDGWQQDIFTTRGGKVHGYSKKAVEARLIRSRRRWLKGGGESGALTWNQGFDYRQAGGSARAHLQVLALIRGLEQYGPFILTMKGSAQMAWYGVGAWRGEGVLETIRSTLIASANKLANTKGKGFHYMAFYSPIGITYIEEGKGKNKKKVPAFVEMGQGDDTTFVVVPQVCFPDEFDAAPDMDAETVAPFMQPRETYSEATELFNEYKEWAEEWDDEETVGADTDAPADDGHEEAEEEDEAATFEHEDLDL